MVDSSAFLGWLVALVPELSSGLSVQMAGEVDLPVVFGGFPLFAFDACVGKLVRPGRSVAIAPRDEGKECRICEVIRVQAEGGGGGGDGAV